MIYYLNDKIFTFCLVLAISNGSYLGYKQLKGTSFKSLSQQAAVQKSVQPHAVAPIASVPVTVTQPEPVEPLVEAAPIPDHQQTQEQIEKLMADEDSKEQSQKSTPSPVAAKINPLPSAPVNTGAAGAYIPFVPTRKPASDAPVERPKSGGNEWLVGKSEQADSRELASVLKKASEGDIINVEGGVHEVGFNMISVDKLKIRGVSPDTQLIYKPNFQPNAFSELTIMNVNLEFAEVQNNYLSLGGGKTKLNLIGVKVNQPKLTLGIRDQFYLVLYDVQFSGVTVRFSGQSKGLITKSYFDSANSLIALADQSDVDLSDSQFYNFTHVAITSDSMHAKFKAKNIKVSNGAYAFWGQFNPHQHEIRESAFSNLKEFTLSGTKVNCSVCEKNKIER